MPEISVDYNAQRFEAGIARVIAQGPATVEELRDAIHEFRDSGKWAVAYMDGAGELYHGTNTYFLASAFEELTMPPSGEVNLVGIIATNGLITAAMPST